MDQEPDKELIKTLLENTVTISQKKVINTLINKPLIEAKGFKKSALLRHSYVIVLDENKKCQVGEYWLTLDDELGLIISGKEE